MVSSKFKLPVKIHVHIMSTYVHMNSDMKLNVVRSEISVQRLI
jgi:hypothetical protein